MAIGLIIIGDEILSGKRADLHLAQVIEILKVRGLQLGWAHYLGDDPVRIVDTLKRTLSGDDIVFSCGGIGSTPDDHTRKCAAVALGVPLALHPHAREKILERIATLARETGASPDPESPDNRNRLRMGELPQGAGIVPNPFNGIPGFSVGSHYFLPGFPEMAWPMIEWVLDTQYSHLFHQGNLLERSIFVYGTMESMLTPLMESVENEFSLVKTFSLPRMPSDTVRARIELGVKGEATQVEAAFARILKWMASRGTEYEAV